MDNEVTKDFGNRCLLARRLVERGTRFVQVWSGPQGATGNSAKRTMRWGLSTDGGSTWVHVGLENSQAIGRIRVHPRDPDVAWVAPLGHPFGPNPERGVYRTRDGGRAWERVLFRDDRTGAVDLAVDPADPDVLYATLWEVYRRPWKLWSGGPGSGLFKSIDGGDTWTELTRNPGLPSGVIGKIGVSVSPVDGRRVYAIVEAQEGGVFRSDDAGETWTRVSEDRRLRQIVVAGLRRADQRAGAGRGRGIGAVVDAKLKDPA